MPFQLNVGDPETGETHQLEIDDQDATRFLGRELGDEVDGGTIGLDGYTLRLTGGSDEAGRPMREDVPGPNPRAVLLEGRSAGFRPSRDGERKRVTVRGSEVTDDIVQLNTTVAERGEQSIADLLGEGDGDEAEDDDAE